MANVRLNINKFCVSKKIDNKDSRLAIQVRVKILKDFKNY